jgi:hypothetical protein
VIANCPNCGTHYKHEPPVVSVRARCGRCDTALYLVRLSPYRIVPATAPTPEHVERAASHLPIGLDHPALATTIARNIARTVPTVPPVRSADLWAHEDPLPPIEEMTLRGAFESSVPEVPDGDILRLDVDEAFGRRSRDDATMDAAPPAGHGAATFALWLATGAIAGTGASWTMGGTTMSGIAAGATLGAVIGWGWLRWTSPQ